MAEILIKIKIEGNSNALAFVGRTQPYLNKTLKEIRQDIVSEVGEKLHLQKCIGEEESGKVFSLSIQVHNSLEKKDSREISTQSSSKKYVSLDAFEKTTRQIQCEVESLEDLKTQRGGDIVAHLIPRENNFTRPNNYLKIVFICNNCRFLIFNFTTSFLLLLI